MSLFSSMHTHTIFCDGEDDVETMCQAAYDKKLFAIGFSAHAPLEKTAGIKTFWNLPDDKAGEYAESVLAAKKRWEGKLNVFLGFEVDYIKGLRSPLDNDITSLNPDFIIGSVHFVLPENGTEPFTVDGSLKELEDGIKNAFDGDADALMNYYYDANIEMIKLGGFDILGHADIIKKNYPDKKPWSIEKELNRQKEIAHLLASHLLASRLLAEKKIAVEVNTGGINRGKIRETYPSLPFLRFLRENNVPVIITADAHRAKDINGNYDKALQTLINADIKNHVIFIGKNNNKLWQNERIQF